MQWMIMKLRDLGKNGFKIMQIWRTVVLAVIALIFLGILIWVGYEYLTTGGVILAIIIILVIILVGILIWALYERIANERWPDWTGFCGYISPEVQPNQTFQRGKTLWDLMQLLIIPVILAGGAYWLNESTRQSEQFITDQRAQIDRSISFDNMQEAALQTYFDRMTELLLDGNLRESKLESEVRAVARARTLTVLRRLDGNRKGALVRFLYEADLINESNCIIILWGAELSGAELREVYLSEACLRGAILSKADLTGAILIQANLGLAHLQEAKLNRATLPGANLVRADLRGIDLTGALLARADLTGADLTGANLTGAHLDMADLTGANLTGANLTGANLAGANMVRTDLTGADLRGARYAKNAIGTRDTIWPEGFDPDATGAIRNEK